MGSTSHKPLEDELNKKNVHLRIIPWRLGAKKPRVFCGALAPTARASGESGGAGVVGPPPGIMSEHWCIDEPAQGVMYIT